ICLEMGELDDARNYYQEAIALFEDLRASLAAESYQITFTDKGAALYPRLVEVLLKQTKPAEALEVVERAKSRALLSLLGTTTLHRPSSIDWALAREEAELLAQVAKTGAEWRNAEERNVALRSEHWGRLIQFRKKLEDVWHRIGQDESCTEYVAM